MRSKLSSLATEYRALAFKAFFGLVLFIYSIRSVDHYRSLEYCLLNRFRGMKTRELKAAEYLARLEK